MTTETTTVVPKFLMPRDAAAVGPQNAAECRLHALLMEGVNSGPSLTTTVAELASELRARIRAR